MKLAICPGSFDPITKGHLDIIIRAAKLFDSVLVVVLHNPEKSPMFTIDERVEMIKRVTQKLSNVSVDTYYGLLADYVKLKGACAIVKGLRAVSDFEYEFQMDLINKQLNPEFETIFLNTSQEYMFLSSSIVKQIAAFNGDISAFIPDEISQDIIDRLHKEV
ncbi:MAG: pantetheine-phosphate adenylyltransferase [Oscillospiraceae bacterium]